MNIKVSLVTICIVICCSLSRPLRLCHLNDFHAKYLEVGEGNVRCHWRDQVEDKCYSGVARLVTAFKQFECDVKIHAGDWVQGSLFDTIFKEQIAIHAYNWIKYDFVTFGNHEFNYGNKYIEKTVRSISHTTTWISSNVFFDGDEMKDLPIHRYVDRYGICWVSGLTEDTATLSPLEADVRIESVNEYMKKSIKECKNSKNVIAITHQGYEQDIKTCKEVQEIDLVIGGHSHTNLENGLYPTKILRDDGSVCLVTTAFAHGRYMGIMDIEFDEKGVIHTKSSAYIALDYRIKPDPEVFSKLIIYNEKATEKTSDEVGTAAEPVKGDRSCRGPKQVPEDGSEVNGDCPMGNMICDAMLTYGNISAIDMSKPRICMMNGGSIKHEFQKGPITIRDIMNVCPFGNTMVSIDMTGKEVLDVLKHGFAGTATRKRGVYPGGLGNIMVKAHMDGSKPDGEKVTINEIRIGGEPLNSNGTYEMLTNSHAASGGDNYVFPEKQSDSGFLIRDVLQLYLEAHIPVTPDPKPRIVMYGTATESINKAQKMLDNREIDNHKRILDGPTEPETELDVTTAVSQKDKIAVDEKPNNQPQQPETCTESI